MQDYFDELYKAIKEFDKYNKEHKMRDDVHDYHKVDPYKYVPIKPLYMLIKVDVDKEIVYNQEQAEKYAENHCNSFELSLIHI